MAGSSVKIHSKVDRAGGVVLPLWNPDVRGKGEVAEQEKVCFVRVARQPDREGRLISRPPVYGALVNPKQ